MDLVLEMLAWGVIVLGGILVYAWILYPLLLMAVAGIRSWFGVRSSELGKEDRINQPLRVAILIAAHNEEMVIAARIQNLIKCRDRFLDSFSNSQQPGTIQIHVGLDGCTDDTGKRARDAAGGDTRVHIHEFPERRGKIGVLKEMVARYQLSVIREEGDGEGCDGEQILVFTDANTRFSDDALVRLVSHFDDPRIGGVCGRLKLGEGGKDSDGRVEKGETQGSGGRAAHRAAATNTIPCEARVTGHEEPVYWNTFETWLKQKESDLDSCLGANGGIYAVRRSCFWEDIPDNTVVDDFVIGMKVREAGKRMVYEPLAVAEEELPEKDEEWGRRVRIGSGDYQALSLCRRCLCPRYGLFAWMFFSHKVLRWFTPHVGAVAVLGAWFVVGCEIRDSWFVTRDWKWWSVLIVAAVATLGLLAAGIGRALRRIKTPLARPFQLADHFVTMQVALFAGWIRYLRGDLKGTWERTRRVD